MKTSEGKSLEISEAVAQAIKQRRPVVALESTVIAHGLPFPINIETARQCEEAVRSEGAEAATTGIVDGVARVGMSCEEIEVFARGSAPDGRRIEKVGLNNLAAVLSKRGWGATTVAGTMQIASRAGLKIFSTGGVGGVHRGAETSLDISSDLTALGKFQMVVVCAGAKAILDLAKTMERLETLGVPVVGYQTDELPAFYSRRSGLPVDVTVDTAEEVAGLALNHWLMGSCTAVLVCAPMPEEFEIPSGEIEGYIEEALKETEAQRVRGKAVTPFLLSRLEKLTEGRTLRANRALLVNNARIAAQVAVFLNRAIAKR